MEKNFKASLAVILSCAVITTTMHVTALAYSSSNENVPGDPPLLAMAALPQSKLAFNPDPTWVAQASDSSINLEDLGFEKKDTQQDADYQKLLNRRTKMLKAHQLFGLATGVAMALALSQASGTQTKGEAGKAAREDHEKYGLATGALYMTTASLMFLAPEVPGQKVSGRTKIHKWLAFIHFPAMLATAYLGITDKKKLDRGEDPSGLKPAVATTAAVSFYAALTVMVIPFGGK